MSHNITVRVDPNANLDRIGRAMKIEEWVENPVLGDRIQEPAVRQGMETEHIYFRYYFDSRSNGKRILRKVGEGVVKPAEWATVQYRQDPIEYRDNQYKRDGDYYNPDLKTGLRTDPKVQKIDHLSIQLQPVKYLINGEKYNVDRQSINFDSHETGQRYISIIGTVDGVDIIYGELSGDPEKPILPSDSVEFATVKTYASEINEIDTKTQYEQYERSERITEYEFGDVPEQW